MVELGEIADINKCSVDPISKFGDEEFIYLDITSVENGTGEVNYSNFIKGKDAPSRARRKISNKDILLSTVRPNLKAFGYVSYNDIDDCVASTGFAVISARSIDSIYLHNALFQKIVLSQMLGAMGKGAYPSINQNDVKSLLIPIPTPEEQRKIAKQIKQEQVIINSNKELIIIFEQKIKDKIAEVWGAES